MALISMDIYARVARPAAAVVVASGILSTVLVLTSEPRVSTIDPETLRYTLAGGLAVFGVVLPAVLLLRPPRPTPAAALVSFLALTANAVVLGGRVAGPPATVALVVAIVVSLLLTTVALVSLAERQASKPPQSKL
jgi:hypothetical protein